MCFEVVMVGIVCHHGTSCRRGVSCLGRKSRQGASCYRDSIWARSYHQEESEL